MGPFATATEFAEFTGMNLPSDLARLQSTLDDASAVIRSFCDQDLDKVSGDVVVLGPSDRNTLLLPERPVTAITSVLEGGVALTAYTFTRSGIIIRTSGTWSVGATVTYDHGYLESEREFATLRTVAIEVAARAFTLNERSASEAIGSTLMESAGYSPEVFLTMGEKATLMDLGKVGVG